MEILERTEYKLTIKIFKAMFCCSLLQLQDCGPRQRLSKIESLFPSAPAHPGPSFHLYFAYCPQCMQRPAGRQHLLLFLFYYFIPLNAFLPEMLHDDMIPNLDTCGFYWALCTCSWQWSAIPVSMTVSRGLVQPNSKLEPQSWSFYLELCFHDISFQ